MNTATNGTNGQATPDQLRRFEELVSNVMTSRMDFLRKFLDPRRDIDEECGHPREGVDDAWMYWSLYERDPIANRVVGIMPAECWKLQPSVYEDEDSDKVTPFEEAWDELGKNLRGEKGWFKEEEGSIIWEYLKRADEMSGIGRYGILLLGINDRKDYSEPVSPSKKNELHFLRAYPEHLAQITKFESDLTNRRFGQPTEYAITLADPREQKQGQGFNTSTLNVHWSRVIHVADGGEVFAQPRMRPVLNRLLDLKKLYGGSAEMYWKGAFPGLSIETPDTSGNIKFNPQQMRDQMEHYFNGLQRYLSLMGFSAKTLAPTVVDPTPQIKIQIEAICIQKAIPNRIFMGSERGELSSGQDANFWNSVLVNRQNTYLTPRLIVPFVDRLINLGVLPEPGKDGWCADWPDMLVKSDTEKADIAAKRTGAMAQYVSGTVESLMPPMDYLTRELGFDEEEAEAILENAEELTEEREAEELLKAEEMGAQGLAPDGTPLPPEVPPEEQYAPEEEVVAAQAVNPEHQWESFAHAYDVV